VVYKQHLNLAAEVRIDGAGRIEHRHAVAAGKPRTQAHLRLKSRRQLNDGHVIAGRGSQPAIIYDSPLAGIKRTFSCAELLDEVSTFAAAAAVYDLYGGALKPPDQPR
jgi:hypothetical protein